MSVEQQNKNKLRKFLNLLKNAQNMPFVELVIKNLSAELCGGLINGSIQRHEKIIKITKFLNDNILMCSDNHFKMKEFTRLSVSSALIQFLISKSLKYNQQQLKPDQQSSLVFEKICQCVIQKINCVDIIPGTKFSKSHKFLESNLNSLIYEIESLKTNFLDLNQSNVNIFQAISLKQILSENSEMLNNCVKSEKLKSSNIELLISEFKNLQRDEIYKQSEQNDDDEQVTREQLIQELDNQDFKLSNFIDSKFLEECLAPVGNLNNKKSKKLSVQKFIEIMENEQQFDKWLVPDLGQILDSRKRQKIDNIDHIQNQIKYLVLSPCLSIILNYSKKLTHEQWEVRQVAASGLQNFIKEVIYQNKGEYQLEYAYISKSDENLFISKYGTINLDDLCSNILPRVIILMLKDQFKDYEDINMVTPVRNQGMNLIQQLCALSISENHQSKQLQKQIQLLLTNLPQLLAVCEHDWQAKQSFFMIFKGIVSANKIVHRQDDNIYRQNLFEIFGKGMIIESITHVEDTVKIIVTQIIGDLLQNYFEQDKKQIQNVSYIDQILINLQEALKLTDDIEGSVIFVFNLIYQIVNYPISKDLQLFNIDCTVLFPFNFHRVLKVRVTLHKLINKLLNLNQLLDKSTLFNLHTLLVQSIIMEDDSILLQILKSNLVLTIRMLVGSNNTETESQNQMNQYVEYLSTYLLMPQRFQNWLYSFEMILEQGCFKEFMFFESPCFEKIKNNYWNVVYQPVGQYENHKFYLKKLYSCLDILAIIAQEANLQQYLKQFLKMNTNPQLISNNTNIEYLFYENISRRKDIQIHSKQQKYSAQSIGIQLSQIGFNFTYIYEFKKFQNLEQLIQSSLNQIQQMPPNGQLQILFNSLLQIQNEFNYSKQNIQLLFQNPLTFPEDTLAPLQQVSNIQQILLNNEQILQILPVLQQKNQKLVLNINEICILVNEMKETLENELSECYKCLLISQHLREVMNSLNKDIKIDLFPKLNDIIYPAWNKLINQKDQNYYFQEINARIITEDLLSCLTSCKKLKARDAIIQMILNVLQKNENKENESGQILTTDIQGCLQILIQWKNQNHYKIFSFYESQQIKYFIQDESIYSDINKCQQYLNCINRFLGVLLIKNEEQQSKQTNEQCISDFIDCVKIIITQIEKVLDIQFQSDCAELQQQIIPEVYQRLFCLLIKEISLNNSFKEQFEFLLTSLIVSLVKSLKNSKSQGISTLNQLLIFCLNPNFAQEKSYDQESDQSSLPSYLTYQGLVLVQSQLCQSEMNQKIIDYIKLFILPIIMNIKSGHQQIIKVLGMIIQLLPICLVSDQQEGKITLQQRISGLAEQNKNEQLYEILEMLQDSEQFLNVFTQQKMNKQPQALSVYPNSSTELREYQKEGIQWMIKLGRYGLNCALCDDMGLGKTIQSLTVVLNESLIERNKNGYRPINMVICPNTLTYQWQQEIKKFFAHTNTNCLVYDASTKYQILNQIKNQQIDIVIVSYEKARQEQNYELLNTNFFYIVLDEGHRIQNSKSKTTIMIKSFKAQRKLVLTGTPLQNKVSELWSIFDFLMPQFLEEEKTFNSKYNQFLTSNLNKLSEKLEETQNFIQALKSLKKRIQPFILRRTKIDVLKDLPPKFIQDFECEMPPAQLVVHQFIDKHFPITQVTQGENQAQKEQGKEKQQIFQNLILHRKVCNHPCFVDETIQNIRNDESKQIVNLLSQIREGKVKKNYFNISFESIKQDQIFLESSGKLKGLVDLLKQCQIIQDENDEVQSENQQKKGKQKKQQNDDGVGLGSGLLQLAPDDENELDNEKFREIEEQNIVDHRALIFCQMKSYLQLIIDSVLIPSGVKFAQLLSQHSGQERFQIVENFNNDTSIKILIMTTAVGGLGLNLTGADTVIFMEHDWNPMKDMQAIDRAHRIGQKRIVNVYRIILRDTLEEKIMGLQRFKKNLAKNLIQSQRSDISLQDAEQMQMHDLLNCFEDHTIIEKQTKNMENGQILDKQEKGLIGVESYKDKVYESIEGIITNQLENM